MPQIFAEISPSTNVPVKGAWLSSILVAIPAFMLDLEAIAFVVSLANLLVYSFMSACGIALRYRESDSDVNEIPTKASTSERYVWAFFLLAFGTAYSLNKGPVWLTIALGLLTFASLVTICCFEQVNRPKKGQYAIPLVPFLPCLSIFFNFVLATSLEAVSWAIFGVMIAVGLLVYLAYGFRNSKLNVPTTAA